MDEAKTKKKGLRIKYNAPVILSFTFLCTLVLVVDQFLWRDFILAHFMVPGNSPPFNPFSLSFYKLVSHAIGHAGWGHLVGNFSFILLIGPILEEKYGSRLILGMIAVTALVTGILNVIFFPQGLLGASGVVFMLILLISFTNIKAGEIPLTFILIVILFLGKELFNIFFADNNISEFAHIIGGIVGGIFGFALGGGRAKGASADSGQPPVAI